LSWNPEYKNSLLQIQPGNEIWLISISLGGMG